MQDLESPMCVYEGGGRSFAANDTQLSAYVVTAYHFQKNNQRRSFTYIIKNSAPKIDPLGSPHVIRNL